MSNISSWLVIKTVAPSPHPPHSFDILITQSSPGPCFRRVTIPSPAGLGREPFPHVQRFLLVLALPCCPPSAV